MTILSVSAARQILGNLVNQVAEDCKEVYIKGIKNNAVLVSEDEWSSTQETLYLMSSPANASRLQQAMAEIEDMVEKKKMS